MMKRRFYFGAFILLFALTLTSCLQSPVPKAEDYALEDVTCAYDGEVHSLVLKGSLPYGYSVVYENNDQSEPGNYEVTATVKADQTEEVIFTLTGNLVIIGSSLDIEFASQNFVYDGSTFELLVGEYDEEKYQIEYSNNEATEVGKYYATAKVYDVESGILVDTLKAIMVIDNPQNEEFEAFMGQFLIDVMEGDQLSVNFFFNNPENYGIEHYDAVLTTYDNSYSYEEGIEEIQAYIDSLHAFEYDQLSYEEQTTYEIVERYLVYIISITENMDYMTNGYLGSYLGYQANLPVELAEYKFRNEQDILDFISILESSVPAFESYVEFTKDQIKYGYAMPDFVIDNVISQCEEFVALGDDNFLIGIFNEKIDNIDFEVVSHTIDEYKELAYVAITGSLTEAYQYVLDNLPELKGNATVYGGLAAFGEEGQEYYLIKLSNVLGINNIDGDALVEYVAAKYEEYYAKLMNVIGEYRELDKDNGDDFYNAVIYDTPFSNYSYEELLVLYREYAKEIVPEIKEMPEISLKYVPESLQNNFSPAAYFVSPIDETRFESVYLNPLYADDYNYVFTTLAHEGYPGHLYQNVYCKSLDINDVRKIVRCSGFMEGWASYVENKAYSFADLYVSEGQRLALEYLRYDNILSTVMSTYFDVAIHYLGYDIEEFTALVNELTGNSFTSTDEAIVSTYEQLIEIPTNMSMYGLSLLVLEDLHEMAEEALGEFFDEVEFNSVLLSEGAAPLDIVISRVKEYINDKTFFIA